jgi:putative hydrolase of the HAD superfamily
MPAVMAQFWSADVINQELVVLIHKLRPNYKVGLLSNAWGDLRQVLDTRIPIGHLFDDLVISAEVGLGKPDPRIYHLAVERLGVQPNEAVFVDDVLANVEAASAIGLNAIHYQNNPQLFSDLVKYNIIA